MSFGFASEDFAYEISLGRRGSANPVIARSYFASDPEVKSEFQFEGRTYRSTDRVVANLFGVDYCSTGDGDDYACVVTLNAGRFLREGTD